MRLFKHISRLLAILIIAPCAGCGLLDALFGGGMQDSQRDWVGDPSQGSLRHADEKMRAQAELNDIY